MRNRFDCANVAPFLLRGGIMAYRSFEDLEVWKIACRISIQVYTILKTCRDYGMKDQMTRASVSIASNIAEGSERDSSKEFVRFLNIAKGSSAELRTQLYIAGEVGIIPVSVQEKLIEELTVLSRKLHKLIQACVASRTS